MTEQRTPADPAVAGRGQWDWKGCAWAVAVVAVTTGIGWPLHHGESFRVASDNILMLYLLGVLWVATHHSRSAAVLASVLSVVAFDAVFVKPYYTLAVADEQYLVTFGVMLAVGLLVGQLTAGLRFQARVSGSRERRARLLFELARDLSGALLASQVAELGEAAVVRHFGGRALVLVADAHDRLMLPSEAPREFDPSVADWCFAHGQPAGYGTSTLAAQPWLYVPLQAPMRVRGVLALQPAQPRWLLIPEQKQQLDTLARQVAIALERVHYVEIAQQALVEMESERLRNALLAAISHDVRTPLTALIGLAEQLRAARPPLAPAQAEAAGALVDQARELNAMVSNLLDMARLQSGAVNLRLQWESLEEVVGTAVRAVRHVLPPGSVRTELPPDLPLVEFDAALIERVLVNLLENAARHGAPPVEIHAEATADALVVRVRDHGPGLPPVLQGRGQQLFEKFTRGQAESSTRGVGLGLAICKAVVDAHRGSITAQAAAGGGAEFVLTLPRRPPPTTPA